MIMTNALRILDKQKIKYNRVEYTYDPDNLDVAKIAADNKMAVASVFKTLVAKGDRTGILVAVISGDTQLNYRALAKVSRNKKVTLIPIKELQGRTGYVRGGCSPIGMKKSFPVYIDEAANEMDEIFVNAGERGLLFGIAPADLQKVTRATIAPISTPIED